MSVFASLIAPFGGFFASGFKRAFRLKDFGDTIPGHGGITDRFDCQVRPPRWAEPRQCVLVSSLVGLGQPARQPVAGPRRCRAGAA
eukprot:201247-Chlamydomonas_euryale.AAC.5